MAAGRLLAVLATLAAILVWLTTDALSQPYWQQWQWMSPGMGGWPGYGVNRGWGGGYRYGENQWYQWRGYGGGYYEPGRYVPYSMWRERYPTYYYRRGW